MDSPRPSAEWPLLNPMRSMPAVQFDRSIDPGMQPQGGGGGSGGDWPLKLVQVDSTNVKVTDGVWWFYFHVDISGQDVTAAELLSNIGGPVPTDDGNNSYRLVGKVTVASGLITVVNTAFGWSKSVVTCTADSTPHVWQGGA